MKIGFIGTGFVGGSMSTEFTERHFEVVKYSLDKEYVNNRDLIKDCDITFIAVPTPSTPEFDVSIVRSSLKLIGDSKIAVIKSTVLPGTTSKLQKEFPNIYVLHSPEFLTEKNALEDSRNPSRNIIGIPLEFKDSEDYIQKAENVLKVLPDCKENMIVSSEQSEIIKYASNFFLTMKVVFANILYEMSEEEGVDYDLIKTGISLDPRIGPSHLDVDPDKRGAGGHCFPKDSQAFYEYILTRDKQSSSTKFWRSANLIQWVIEKNKQLLVESGKDVDILTEIYGKDHLDKYK